MNKVLMISIRPEHAVNILNGKKTLELRTWIPKDYVGWVYVYCTKGTGRTKYHHLYNLTEYNNGKTLFSITHHNKYSLVPDDFLNGTIPFRFWFDEYAEIKLNVYTSLSTTYFESFNSWDNVPYEEQSGVIDSNYLEDITQVSFPDMKAYAKGKTLYAWHIKKLEIFDEPLSLNDFYKATLYASGKVIKEYEKQTDDFSYRLQRPPQSYQYVYTKELENEKLFTKT